ncbi:uncharacterized protein LOC118409054, partial [Branchiostoma floridae]|uniref:Uncharacterized protein LOC118409054 n=1 Tax=Branchiostoma floridae TaxID=7739 RepID=A0A9J7HTW9_BRAFL
MPAGPFHGDGGTAVNRRRQTPERADGVRTAPQRDMASLGKLLGRALSLPAQLLPASRRLHMPADGPGWEFIKGLGGMSAQLPAADLPNRADLPSRARNICTEGEGLSVNAVIIKAAMEGAESCDISDTGPSAADLRLLEHAEVFGLSAPSYWCLRSQASRQLPTSWTFRGGKLP